MGTDRVYAPLLCFLSSPLILSHILQSNALLTGRVIHFTVHYRAADIYPYIGPLEQNAEFIYRLFICVNVVGLLDRIFAP